MAMNLFIHGVPDTPHLWEPLVAALGLQEQDYLAPALPGFGCPRPDGFSATKDAYADWLVGQMEAAGGNVDIVGHDWGALLTLRAASLRPDLVRSLCWVSLSCWACATRNGSCRHLFPAACRAALPSRKSP